MKSRRFTATSFPGVNEARRLPRVVCGQSLPAAHRDKIISWPGVLRQEPPAHYAPVVVDGVLYLCHGRGAVLALE
jgi:hypothetical protein